MKARSATELLDHLILRAEENHQIVTALSRLSEQELHQRPQPDAWSALEAIEHLNLWNDLYLGRTEAAIANTTTSPSPEFTSSWLGNKFAAGMKPGSKTRKVPTLRKLKPRTEGLTKATIDTWLKDAERQRSLLDEARAVDLTRVKIKTALTSLLSMRLGDALRMIVYHNWRHIEQAERATRGLAGIRTS